MAATARRAASTWCAPRSAPASAENTILVGRRPNGEIYCRELAERFPPRDWILTRIRLSGSIRLRARLATALGCLNGSIPCAATTMYITARQPGYQERRWAPRPGTSNFTAGCIRMLAMADMIIELHSPQGPPGREVHVQALYAGRDQRGLKALADLAADQRFFHHCNK
jgi:hypothetical protein